MVNIGLRVLARPDQSQLPSLYRELGKDFDERVLPSIINEVGFTLKSSTAYLRICLSAYLPSCLLMYSLTCLPTYLHLLTHLSELPAYLHTNLPKYLPSCITLYLHTYLCIICIPEYRSLYVIATRLLNCLHTYLPITCISA